MTATLLVLVLVLVLMLPRFGRLRPMHHDGLGSSYPPVVLSGLGALGIDLAGARDARCDCNHDPLRGGVHILVGADGHRLPDHCHLGDPPPPPRLAALEEGPVGAPEPHGRDRHSGLLGKARGARLGRHRFQVERDGALGEHRDALAPAQRLDRGVERPGRVGGLAFDGDLAGVTKQEADAPLVEQLGFGEETHPPMTSVGDVGERERIQVRRVIGRENHRPTHRDAVPVFDRPLHPVTHRYDACRAQDGIHDFHGR